MQEKARIVLDEFLVQEPVPACEEEAKLQAAMPNVIGNLNEVQEEDHEPPHSEATDDEQAPEKGHARQLVCEDGGAKAREPEHGLNFYQTFLSQFFGARSPWLGTRQCSQ